MRDALLYVHIAAGFTGLAIGILPMIFQKGSRLHKRSGKIYFYAMLIASLTALPLALFIENLFLFSIGIFSFYLVFTGYRQVHIKYLNQIRFYDKFISYLMLTISIGMLVLASSMWLSGIKGLAITLFIFGLIGLILSIADIKHFNEGTRDKFAWLTNHITRINASYIAATTAFAVTNFDFLPQLVQWIGPTVIGTIAISFTMRKYKKRIALFGRPFISKVE